VNLKNIVQGVAFFGLLTTLGTVSVVVDPLFWCVTVCAGLYTPEFITQEMA
jgi:hypothetical protein